MSTTPNITFVGAGNMASSIIGGLIGTGFPAAAITACDPNAATLDALHQRYGIAINSDNRVAVSTAEVVVLAVKPQVMQAVCELLDDALPAQCLVLSIAAGISSDSLRQWLSGTQKARSIVRCMPNTPALVQAGASGLYANNQVSDDQRRQAELILSAVGKLEWLDDEGLLDAVTAVSGSGPAYFFLLIEAMTEAGIKQGLKPQTAAALAKQTAFGAAKLALESDEDAAELRRRVTSPNGTTAAAMASFESMHFQRIVDTAMQACAERSRELAKELG